jgi:hypothetical protein
VSVLRGILQEKVLTVNVSEVIYTNIAYLVQKLIDVEDADDLSYSGLLKNNFGLLSPEKKAL